MRISDWSSDVCSSDLPGGFLRILGLLGGNHDGGETAKGRRMGAAAAFRFCTVEAFAVIMHQRLDDGRRRTSRLDEHAAGLLAPTGAAGYLCDLLECPLRCAEIAPLQPKVGIDHPHQRQIGEVDRKRTRLKI